MAFLWVKLTRTLTITLIIIIIMLITTIEFQTAVIIREETQPIITLVLQANDLNLQLHHHLLEKQPPIAHILFEELFKLMTSRWNLMELVQLEELYWLLKLLCHPLNLTNARFQLAVAITRLTPRCILELRIITKSTINSIIITSIIAIPHRQLHPRLVAL